MRTASPTTRRTASLDLIGQWLFQYMASAGLLLCCNDFPHHERTGTDPQALEELTAYALAFAPEEHAT